MVKLGGHLYMQPLTQRNILVDVGRQVSLKVSQLFQAGILDCLA